MSALTIAEATAAFEPDLVTAPVLRRLPVPLAEPRPALRVVAEAPPDPTALQDALLFTDDPDAEQGGTALALLGSVAPRLGDGPSASTLPGTTTDLRSGRKDAAGGAASTDPATEEPTVGPTAPGTATPPRELTIADPIQWTRRFVQAAVEVAAGQRPATQLVRWTSEDVLTSLARRGRLTAQRRGSPRVVGRTEVPRRAVVLSAHLSYPARDVVEACAVVNDGGRMRAVALRIEGHDGRSRVTAFEIG